MCEVSRRNVLAGASLAAFAAGFPSVAEAATRPLPAATVAARRKFFGAESVAADGRIRRDRVILAWFGCTSFAMAIGGHVVLLDAWVPRGLYADRVPASLEELVALRPSHIVIGHGHFDHAADAAPIAAASGAVVVGTPEHCAQIKAQAGGSPIRTQPLQVRGVGDTASFSIGKVKVRAMRHLHSEVKTPTGEDSPVIYLPDLTPLLTNPTTVDEALFLLAHQGDQEGGSVMYRFEYKGFSLVWNDTAGPLRDAAPQVLRALRAKRRADVQIGSIAGFGQYTNGLRDPMDYVRAMRPRIFVPSHHDNWLPGLSTNAVAWEPRLRSQLALLPASIRPALRFIEDPQDYVRPARLKFRV